MGRDNVPLGRADDDPATRAPDKTPGLTELSLFTQAAVDLRFCNFGTARTILLSPEAHPPANLGLCIPVGGAARVAVAGRRGRGSRTAKLRLHVPHEHLLLGGQVA